MKAKETAKKAFEMLHELKCLCYSKKSNDIFDQLYDSICAQLAGLDEAMGEAECANDWDAYSSEFIRVLEMAKKIKAYHKASKIKWVYC